MVKSESEDGHSNHGLNSYIKFIGITIIDCKYYQLDRMVQNPVFYQNEKLMAGTKFSDYLGLNHYKKTKKIKHFIHLGLAQGPQSFATYRSISPSGNLGNQLKNHVLVM